MDKIRCIGIVTVTYNSAEVLPEFLQTVFSQTFGEFLLYVVDNASRDESVALISQCIDPRIRVIANTGNLGVAEGNNQGIRAALADGCDAVLLLNNDTILAPDLLEQLREGFEHHGCDLTTGKMYFDQPANQIWCAGGHFVPLLGYLTRHDGEGQTDCGQFDEPRRVTYTPTCCLMIRSSVFERTGFMDSKYFVYHDDVDFLYRCMKNNISMWYVPGARLWHKVSSLTGATSDFLSRYAIRNRIYFVRKYLPNWQAHSWYWFEQARSTLAFLVRHIERSKWLLRLSAAKEGWRMIIDRDAPSASPGKSTVGVPVSWKSRP